MVLHGVKIKGSGSKKKERETEMNRLVTLRR